MKMPKMMRKREIITSYPDTPRSCSLFTVADMDSWAPLRREASSDARKFFPMASFVGPKIDIIGTMKPKSRRLVTIELVVRPYSPAFFTMTYITSLKASVNTNEKIRLSKQPGIEKLKACTMTKTRTWSFWKPSARIIANWYVYSLTSESMSE